MKETTEREALLRLTALCSQAEHCAHEMTEKMGKWGLAPEAQARVMAALVEGKFVDDGRYAAAFVRDKLKYNKWGRRKIDQALWAKHIDEATRRDAIDAIDGEEWLAALRPLLHAKRRSTRAASPYELNNKLARFALGRGFTMEEIRRCLGPGEDIDESCDVEPVD